MIRGDIAYVILCSAVTVLLAVVAVVTALWPLWISVALMSLATCGAALKASGS
jgi:hypothetical protein